MDKLDKVRVCVLSCSYEDSDSELRQYEADCVQTPQHFFSPTEDPKFEFTLVYIKKSTAYRQIRQLVKSGKYDVFFNHCDGSKDEDRPGVEVVQALEEFHVPYTGSRPEDYEISKPDMKLIAFYNGITTARHAVLDATDDVRHACGKLRFPLIVKHISGYCSIGMDKSCKVFDMDALVPRVAKFIETYQFALVEEFITGDEATILVCGDSSQPDGVRVFHPVKVQFPEGEDFKHFQLKWEAYEGMEWQLVDAEDPALPQMISIARTSFRKMMSSKGYGRVDVRIDRTTNEVYYLELNTNCGIMYPFGEEGSADWILRLSPDFKQKEFAILQMREAFRLAELGKPLYRRSFDPERGNFLCALSLIPAGTLIFKDEGRAVRLCTRPFVEKHWSKEDVKEFAENAWPVGAGKHYYCIWDISPASWRAFNHSCSPNMSFGAGHSLNVYTIRDVLEGEELTMDYRTFMDDTMPSFVCRCGASNCAGKIRCSTSTPSIDAPRHA